MWLLQVRNQLNSLEIYLQIIQKLLNVLSNISIAPTTQHFNTVTLTIEKRCSTVQVTLLLQIILRTGEALQLTTSSSLIEPMIRKQSSNLQFLHHLQKQSSQHCLFVLAYQNSRNDSLIYYSLILMKITILTTTTSKL